MRKFKLKRSQGQKCSCVRNNIKFGFYRWGNYSGEKENLREDLQSAIILSYTTTMSDCFALFHKKRRYIDFGYRHYFKVSLHTSTRHILPNCRQGVQLE